LRLLKGTFGSRGCLRFMSTNPPLPFFLKRIVSFFLWMRRLGSQALRLFFQCFSPGYLLTPPHSTSPLLPLTFLWAALPSFSPLFFSPQIFTQFRLILCFPLSDLGDGVNDVDFGLFCLLHSLIWTVPPRGTRLVGCSSAFPPP